MDRSQQINPFIQETEPKRHYIKVYLDFLDSSLLDLEEKGVYLCLKRFADFSLDSNGIVDKVYPKISDLVKITGKSKNCVGAILSSLDEKGAIEKIRQGLTKPNIYILSDREEMWYADSYDKMRMYARESDIERTMRILEDLKAGNVVDRSTRQRYEYDPYKVAQALSGTMQADDLSVIMKDMLPKRLSLKAYMDMLDCTFLTLEEKVIFLMLKRFLDVRNDHNGVSGQVYPSMQALSDRTGKTVKTIGKILQSLADKNVIQKTQRGLNQSNLYMLSDYTGTWSGEQKDNSASAQPLTPLDQARLILEQAGYTVQKNPALLPPLSSSPVSFPSNGEGTEEIEKTGWTARDTSLVDDGEAGKDKKKKRQSANVAQEPYDDKAEGRTSGNKDIADNNVSGGNDGYQPVYSSAGAPFSKEALSKQMQLNLILDDPNIMPSDKRLALICLNIVFDTVNSQKKTVSINGEPVRIERVREVFLSLSNKDVIFAIGKFQAVGSELKNATSYLRSILFQSGNGERELQEINKANSKERDGNGGDKVNNKERRKREWNEFPQRNVDYDGLFGNAHDRKS